MTRTSHVCGSRCLVAFAHAGTGGRAFLLAHLGAAVISPTANHVSLAVWRQRPQPSRVIPVVPAEAPCSRTVPNRL